MEPTPEPESAPSLGIELSPSNSVEEGEAITATMSFSDLETDSDAATVDYIFRADVLDAEGKDADGCEGAGMGVDRNFNKVDEDPEVRTGSTAADCPPGAYTFKVTLSSADNTELASASAGFGVLEEPTIVFAPAPGSPGTANSVLVSNIGQTDFTAADLGPQDWGQTFTTGAHAGGYNLTSIELNVAGRSASTPDADLEVSVRSVSSGNTPGDVIHTLTPPDSWTSGNITFTASNVALGANTTYFVWVSSSGSVSMTRTESDDEDAGAAAGWSIGDSYYTRNRGGSGAASQAGFAFEFRVNGHGEPRTSAAAAMTVTKNPLPQGIGHTTPDCPKQYAPNADGTFDQSDYLEDPTGCPDVTHTDWRGVYVGGGPAKGSISEGLDMDLRYFMTVPDPDNPGENISKWWAKDVEGYTAYAGVEVTPEQDETATLLYFRIANLSVGPNVFLFSYRTIDLSTDPDTVSNWTPYNYVFTNGVPLSRDVGTYDPMDPYDPETVSAPSGAPSKPTLQTVTADQHHGGRATLSWTAPTGATGYEVLVKSEEGARLIIDRSAPETRYVHVPLPAGKLSWFRVRAVNATGAGPWSEAQRWEARQENGAAPLPPTAGPGGAPDVIASVYRLKTIPTDPLYDRDHFDLHAQWSHNEGAYANRCGSADATIRVKINDASDWTELGSVAGGAGVYRGKISSDAVKLSVQVRCGSTVFGEYATTSLPPARVRAGLYRENADAEKWTTVVEWLSEPRCGVSESTPGYNVQLQSYSIWASFSGGGALGTDVTKFTDTTTVPTSIQSLPVRVVCRADSRVIGSATAVPR